MTGARSPEHRAKLSAAAVRRWADPVFRAKMTEAARAGARHSWDDPDARAKRTEAMRGPRELTPATRAAMSAASVRKWEDPERRAKMSEAMRASAVRTWKDPATRAKRAEATRVASVRMWKDPARRAKGVAAAKRTWKDPARRAKMAALNIGNQNVRNAAIKGECVYCFGPATQHDHIVPRGRSGWDDPENVALACLSCNASKGRRTPDEWLGAGLVGRRT